MYKINMVTPIAVAGILTLSVLAAISFNDNMVSR
jgi:hypothetical protein